MILETKCNIGDTVYFLSMLGNKGTGDIVPFTCGAITYTGKDNNLQYRLNEAYMTVDDNIYNKLWFTDYNLAFDALKNYRERTFGGK